MRFRTLALTACALTSTEAAALSCSFGNTASAWHEARQFGPQFLFVRGRFDVPVAGLVFEEEAYRLTGRFSGVVIDRDGTTRPLETPIMVVGECANGDCGYLAPDSEVLTFLHRKAGRFVTYSMPCGNFPLSPEPQVAADILSCMNAGPCEPEYDH